MVISGRRNNTLGSCADLLHTSVNEIAFQEKFQSGERKSSSFNNMNNFSIMDFNQHATMGKKINYIFLLKDLSICMEEKSIRENSYEGSIESKSTFGQNPSKYYPIKLTKLKEVKNISQLSMMNNIQNQPFPKELILI